ncbi:MAG: hypothetical protein M4579_005715 [Chaenotheca gracillima]|nr:MAG: hypothetical protein M4579_005715 [Chaenotheca gracillima]
MASMDRAEMGRINPELEKLMEGRGTKPMTEMPDFPALRASIAARQKANYKPKDDSGLFIEDRKIETRDNAKIGVRIYRPDVTPEGGSPLVVVFHGGAFCMGGLGNEDDTCRHLVRQLHVVAVNVDYRLAPENPFPTAVHDSYDSVKWALAHAAEIKADPTKGFIVGGSSAGANLSVVFSHQARDEKLSPPLTGVWLAVPAVVDASVVPEEYKPYFNSFHDFKDAPVLSHANIKFFQKALNPDKSSALYSPLLWPEGHADLPPAYFQVCGLDPFRDEAFIYEKVLRDEGIQTKTEIYPGMPHGFWSFFPEHSVTKTFREDSVSGVKWLLEQTNDIKQM